MLFLRAILAFLLLPVSLAGVVPAWWLHGRSWASGGMVPGLVLLLLGTGLLLWCVRDFLVSGRGTLAPWDPPRRLVVIGLYRFTRNPMYGAVLLIVAGWSLLYAAPSLGLYLVGLAIGFHLRVRWVEEPRLQQRFGSDWESYARHTNRWLPKRHDSSPSIRSASSIVDSRSDGYCHREGLLDPEWTRRNLPTRKQRKR